MAEFLHAYKRVLKNEGGYSNRNSDKGGETYCGISRRWNPTWSGWKIIDSKKPLDHGELVGGEEMESLVRTFYKQTKWDRIKADAMNSQWVAEFIVDWFITSDNDAVKALQTAVGISTTGNVGDATIAAVNAADEEKLKARLIKARKVFYQSIVKAHPEQLPNLKGWLNRVDSFA